MRSAPYESITANLDLVVICRTNSYFQQCSQEFVMNTFPEGRFKPYFLFVHFQNNLSVNAKFYCR